MGAEILGFEGGILTVKVTGRLEQADLEAAQTAAAEAIRKNAPVRVLVLTEDFKGWAKRGNWGDLDFQIDNDRYIEKMAVVADESWEDLILMFTGKGLRPFPIEHFPPADADRARAWLAA